MPDIPGKGADENAGRELQLELCFNGLIPVQKAGNLYAPIPDFSIAINQGILSFHKNNFLSL